MKFFETDFWDIKLLENQYYLGRSVVLLKRDCEELSGLTDEEFMDLFEIIKRLESSMKNIFGVTNSSNFWDNLDTPLDITEMGNITLNKSGLYLNLFLHIIT